MAECRPDRDARLAAFAWVLKDYRMRALDAGAAVYDFAKDPDHTFDNTIAAVESARQRVALKHGQAKADTIDEAVTVLLCLYAVSGPLTQVLLSGKEPDVRLEFYDTAMGATIEPEDMGDDPGVPLGRIMAAMANLDMDTAQTIFRTYAAAYPGHVAELIARAAFACVGRAHPRRDHEQ